MDTYEKKYNEAMLRADEAVQKGCLDKNIFDIIFPPEESEDERIRKAIIYNLSNLNIIYNATKEECLAWLEKVTDESDKIAAAYQLGRSDERKEQKDFRKLYEDIAKGEFVSNASWEDKLGFQYCSLDESKTVEWSEEDKRKLNRIYSIIGWAMDEHAFSSCKKLLGDKEGVELQDFLRSIAKPKAEWSDYKDKVNVPYCSSEPEWSEEDEQLIGFIFDLLNDLFWRKDWAMSKEECLERLKSLRPSWKPSEEQMEALQCAIAFMEIRKASDYDISPLKSLYEQLNKL